MRHQRLKHLFLGAAWIMVAAVAALWSWNTLASLFGAPEAEIRHVVAVFALILLVKFALLKRHGSHALSSSRR